MKIVTLLLGLLVSTAYSQTTSLNQNYLPKLNSINTAVPFLTLSPAPHAAGLGDAGLGIGSNSNSLFWNSASMVFSENVADVSINYSPWLRALVSDINLANCSGYGFIDQQRRHVLGGSVKLFDMGRVNFTDEYGNIIGYTRPTDMEVLVGYAVKLSDKSGIGVNVKYVQSRLFGNISVDGITHGHAVAADLSYFYKSEKFSMGSLDNYWSWGVTVSNLGNKISYGSPGEDFIPANLRLGASLKSQIGDSHELMLTANANKLLVPTPPAFQNGQIVAGLDPNVSPALGWIRSFYDAPGNVSFGSNGEVIVEDGSRAREEMNEITLGVGLEYGFKEFVFARGGYFHEHFSKGNRKFFTVGLGFKFYNVAINSSFLISTVQNSTIHRTLRFGASYTFKSRGEKAESPVVN